MQKDNLKHETPTDANNVLVAGLSLKPKKLPWNWGKRKPEPDQDGDLWCSCLKPKLTSNAGGRGQAYCLLCGTPYYH
jgi:hypothetical protein